MSWQPAYFAAGEVGQGTIEGLFFGLIKIESDDLLIICMSLSNNAPLLKQHGVRATVVNDNKISYNYTYNDVAVYPGALIITDKATQTVIKRTLWVNTTKPLPLT